jgi:hypothetical protein
MAELQFLRADRTDIDAYRTQPLMHSGCFYSHSDTMGFTYCHYVGWGGGGVETLVYFQK